MERPPRRPGTPLLDRPLLVRTVAVAVTLTVVALGVFELEHDRQLAGGVSERLSRWHVRRRPPSRPRSSSGAYLLTCRSLATQTRIGWWSNPSVYVGILVVLVLQVAFVTLSPMHAAFGSARPDFQALALAARRVAVAASGDVAGAVAGAPSISATEAGPRGPGFREKRTVKECCRAKAEWLRFITGTFNWDCALRGTRTRGRAQPCGPGALRSSESRCQWSPCSPHQHLYRAGTTPGATGQDQGPLAPFPSGSRGDWI